MSSLLAIVLPLAFGAAISPSITIIVLALLAGKDHPRARATAFLVGVVAVMMVWAVIIWSAMWSLIKRFEADVESFSATLARDYSDVIDIGLGLLLLAFGVWRLLVVPKARNSSDSATRFKISNLGSGGYGRQVAFGAIMQGRNVTSLVLFFSAQQHIVSAPLPFADRVFTTLLVIGILSASTWLPMLIPVTGTSKLRVWLAPVGHWISGHARQVEGAVAIAFSIYLMTRWLWALQV